MSFFIWPFQTHFSTEFQIVASENEHSSRHFNCSGKLKKIKIFFPKNIFIFLSFPEQLK